MANLLTNWNANNKLQFRVHKTGYLDTFFAATDTHNLNAIYRLSVIAVAILSR